MSVRPMALHVYAHMHACALIYEHNYYVVVRIGARAHTMYTYVRLNVCVE